MTPNKDGMIQTCGIKCSRASPLSVPTAKATRNWKMKLNEWALSDGTTK